MNVLKVKNKGFETFISILLENVKKNKRFLTLSGGTD